MARQDDRPDSRRAAQKAGRLAASGRITALRAPTPRPAAASGRPAPASGDAAPGGPDPALDARALFRAAVADARPLRQPPRMERPAPRVRPLPLQRWADDREVLTESLERTVDWDFDRQTGESLAYKREGVQLQVFRRLRRGHWVVQSELDLHGLTREEARAALGRFLAECLRRGLRCVRVIHGKGLGSRNREPVLKAKVAGWLAQREAVLAFCEAPPRDGGSGAVLVLLRAG
ncbi:MAG: Smr/MutS family protein [Pseudomonadota bacterium]|jgi:DNA-nicking Smr family endonuclease